MLADGMPLAFRSLHEAIDDRELVYIWTPGYCVGVPNADHVTIMLPTGQLISRAIHDVWFLYPVRYEIENVIRNSSRFRLQQLEKATAMSYPGDSMPGSLANNQFSNAFRNL